MKSRRRRRRHLRVDVTGRLVGEQKLGFADHRAGDSGALLLSAGQNRRIGVHPVAKSHPFQELGDVLRVIALLAARDPQGKRHILPGRQMIEQPEVLKNDADPASEVRALRRRILGNIPSEKMDKPARRPERHEQEP